MTEVPAISEMGTLNVTKCVWCPRYSHVIQSRAGLGLAASCQLDTDPHTVHALEVPHDGTGRTQAMVERKCRHHNHGKIISNRCVITIHNWGLYLRDWKT